MSVQKTALGAQLKYVYAINKGDAIFTANGVGIVTKKTKSYFYYFFDGHESRISKIKLWRALDTKFHDAELRYSKKMKYRRKQRKMRTLDLHNTKHSMVEEKVRSFLNFVELPCTIITGKSKHMKSVVEEVVKEYGWVVSPLVSDFDGHLVITE